MRLRLLVLDEISNRLLLNLLNNYVALTINRNHIGDVLTFASGAIITPGQLSSSFIHDQISAELMTLPSATAVGHDCEHGKHYSWFALACCHCDHVCMLHLFHSPCWLTNWHWHTNLREDTRWKLERKIHTYPGAFWIYFINIHGWQDRDWKEIRKSLWWVLSSFRGRAEHRHTDTLPQTWLQHLLPDKEIVLWPNNVMFLIVQVKHPTSIQLIMCFTSWTPDGGLKSLEINKKWRPISAGLAEHHQGRFVGHRLEDISDLKLKLRVSI